MILGKFRPVLRQGAVSVFKRNAHIQHPQPYEISPAANILGFVVFLGTSYYALSPPDHLPAQHHEEEHHEH